MHHRVSIWVLGAVLLGGGAGAADRAESVGWGGPLHGVRLRLAGRDLNGVALNGSVLDGRAVDHVSLEGGTLRGEPLRNLRLEASRFKGRAGRRAVVGEGIVGAELAARLVDGEALTVRVDAAVRGRGGYDRDVTRYKVSYRTVDGWKLLCGRDDQGEPILAVPLEGRWDHGAGTPGGGDHIDDPAAFTFACGDYVLAHCVDAGYAPWRRTRACQRGRCGQITLAAHHQACTRMMRADYCGDGRAHTVDDTPINAYDNLQVRVDSEDWLFEAEWDERGARCMVEERVAGNVPACAGALVRPSCGDASHLRTGALLMSEVKP